MVLELHHRNRSLFTGFQDAGQHFLPIETFAAAVFFDDHVGNLIDSFVARESPLAAETLPAPADRIAFLAFSRVDHFVVEMAAEWTLHVVSSPRRSLRESPVYSIYMAAMAIVGA